MLYVDGGSERLLGEELPALAKEVARVEAVRTYAGEYFFHFILYFCYFFKYFSSEFFYVKGLNCIANVRMPQVGCVLGVCLGFNRGRKNVEYVGVNVN